MHLAAERNYFDVAELLIRSGANVDSEDNVSTVFIPTYLTTNHYAALSACMCLYSILRDMIVLK